ncbi:MAG: presqualene diphosphate synthase HpnD [Deltaproteobacteria bacterium]|nr:presqualene diphosphate synthase HpnD [Deltaproteobacteria bacterium]
MTSNPYSRQIARSSGSNFYYSFFFLSPERRNGIMTLYAFSRLVDDAVDEASDERHAREELSKWRKRLDLCFNGFSGGVVSELAHPILPELSRTIKQFGLLKESLVDLLKGVEMDLVQKRYAAFQELETYCYHVASTVGLLCNQLFGYSEEAAREHAILLGKAFQLTNILRDVGNDARRGRIYLPQDEMLRYGVREEDILQGRRTDEAIQLFSFQAKRAEDYFQKASQALDEKKRRKILPAAIMTAFYHRILERIKEEGFPVLGKKVSLSKFEKIRLLSWALVKSM